jgi:exopolyphosphatase / guanosine-5'-triphosphate,3'-diphosphate pyrophosphatase
VLRVAVVDVGSTSAHVDVLDIRRHRPPTCPVTTRHKVSLSRKVEPDGRIGEKSVAGLVRAVDRAMDTASRHGARGMVAFATSVVRDAPNRDEVLARVAARTGVRLDLLTPHQEARLTYEGARAWSEPALATPLLVVDVGGGTAELALGTGRKASRVASAPLGARRLTLRELPGDPPRPRDIDTLRDNMGRAARALVARVGPLPRDTTGVAASRVLAQLALLTAHEAGTGGEAAGDTLSLCGLRRVIPLLAGLTWRERAQLPGVSRSRAPHILAGAIVAEGLMAGAGMRELRICPWGLREGIALRLPARAGDAGHALMRALR